MAKLGRLSETTLIPAKRRSRSGHVAELAAHVSAVVLFWSVVWLQSVAWRYYVTRPRTVPVRLEFIATLETVMFAIAALLTPGIIWAARRFPLERGRRLQSCAAHFVCGTAFAVLVKLVWDIAIQPWYRGPWLAGPFTWNAFVTSVFDGFQVNLLLYFIVVIGVTAVDQANRYRRAALEAAELRAQLAETRLEALRRQLDPHFLFNTLHGIAAMVHSDPDGAESMIANLSELLRRSLDHGDRQEAPLSVEIAFTKTYLDIQSRRFEDRLEVHYEIGPGLDHLLVPDMLLQPLVENSIRHAIARRMCGGAIVVRAAARDDELYLEVEDQGGEPAEPVIAEGVGLRTTRERLAVMYGGRASLRVTPGESGMLVRIGLPVVAEEQNDAVAPVASHHC